jgi:tRNA A-37 threonylcarbamoyl transferase component Bud32
LATLHGAGYGHGDLRWPNVIQTSHLRYVLIDLEGVVKLNVMCTPPFPVSWRNGAVLQDESMFTAQSDLRMLADMIEQAHSREEDVQSFIDGVRAHTITSADAAREHPWLKD